MVLDNNFQIQLPQLENVIEANPPTASPETSVFDVIEQLSLSRNHNVIIYGCVLIVDRAQKLVGIITEKDIVRLTAAQSDLATLQAGEVMSKNVITLQKSALSDLNLVLRTLRQHQIRHLPIVDDRKELEGIISFNNICQAIHPSSLLKFRRVSEVMNPEVLCASPTTSVLELSQLMLKSCQNYVVIIKQNSSSSYLTPLGIITERDLVRLQLQKRSLTDTKAESVMSHPLECLSPKDPLLLVQQKMNELRVRRLVVTGEEGQLEGIVTQLNMIRAIDPEEVHNLVTTLQQQLHLKTQKIRQINQKLRREVQQHQVTEAQLIKEKELAQITLQSIGDGVITTNMAEEIEEFNSVAEQLTGWQAAEVIGKSLSSIVQVCEEHTKQPIATPLERAFNSNLSYSLSQRSILIARDGTEYAIRDSVAPICDRQGKTLGIVWIFHDVTESRRLTDRLSWQASHDTLTGLYNRRKFDEKLHTAIASAREEGLQHALCYCDLDRFKVVNDTCGHSAGDEVLRQVATLLSQRVRSADTLARLGGDEFGLLLYQCPVSEAISVAETLRQSICNFRFTWEDDTFSLGISIGIAAIDSTTSSSEELINKADAACYTAKFQGRDRIHLATD